MPAILSDSEIDALLEEPKPLPSGFRGRIKLRPKRGHQQAELGVVGSRGSDFRVILRRSNSNPLDFSVVLAYVVPRSTQVIRLRRYNGKSHEHTNDLEGDRFYDFHIHYATERYQQSGNREDAYAEPSDRYATMDEALACLFSDCAFIFPDDDQPHLFDIWPRRSP